MKNYVNNTRFDSIITISVEGSGDILAAFHVGEVGNKDVYALLPGVLGINDIEVPAGKEFWLSENTVATLLFVRSSPR